MARRRDERQAGASLRQTLARPFPIWRGAWPEARFIGLATLFVAALVLATRPFGLQNLAPDQATPLILQLAAVCAVASLTMRVAAPAVLHRLLDDRHWTVGSEIAWACLEAALMATGLMVVLDGHGYLALSAQTALLFVAVTGLCAVVPVFIRTLLVERWLRERHQRLAESLPEPCPSPPADLPVRVVGEDGVVELGPGALRYLRAEENYVEVVWRQEGQRRHRLLRSTLSAAEGQLGGQALRCHRSYVVALAAVTEVAGNAQGYRLSLIDLDETVPVSRARAAGFFAALRVWRSG